MVPRLDGEENDADCGDSVADLEVLMNVVEEAVSAWDLVPDGSERSCGLIRSSVGVL